MTKKQEVANVRKQNERLMKMVAEAREKERGYQEVAKANSAYISVLLKRLGATEDNVVDIKASEVTEALQKYEARAMATDGGFALYLKEVEV